MQRSRLVKELTEVSHTHLKKGLAPELIVVEAQAVELCQDLLGGGVVLDQAILVKQHHIACAQGWPDLLQRLKQTFCLICAVAAWSMCASVCARGLAKSRQSTLAHRCMHL